MTKFLCPHKDGYIEFVQLVRNGAKVTNTEWPGPLAGLVDDGNGVTFLDYKRDGSVGQKIRLNYAQFEYLSLMFRAFAKGRRGFSETKMYQLAEEA